LRVYAEDDGLGYDPATRTGVVFYMLRALGREGHLSAVAIAGDRAACDALWRRLEGLLERLALDRSTRAFGQTEV
jgi:hypothetical protein